MVARIPEAKDWGADPLLRRPKRRRGRSGESVLVAVVLGLVGALLVDADVLGLLFGELGELRVQGLELEAGDLLVEGLGQDVDAHGVLRGVREELDLREGLV